MSEANDIERVIHALSTVPEKSLLIVEIANEVTDKKGAIVFDKLVDRQPEVNLAVAEAKAYVQGTQKAIQALKSMPARKGGY